MIPHTSKFVEKKYIDPLHPEKGYIPLQKNEFYIDPELIRSRKYNESTQIAWLHILLKYYKLYLKYGHIPIPKVVAEYNDKFIQGLDTIIAFINICLERTDNEKDVLRCSDIYHIYISWYKTNYGSTQIPIPLVEFREHLETMKEYNNITGCLHCFIYKKSKTDNVFT
jgi:hypothetical protein